MKTARTHYNANLIREKYNSGQSNLRQLAKEFNSSISTIKKIVDNDIKHFYDPFYTKTERIFDISLACILHREGVSLKKIAEVCSISGEPYSLQGCLNQINKANGDDKNSPKDKDKT